MTGEFAAMQGQVVEQEIRRVIYPLHQGHVEGYEWRWLVNHPPMAGQPAKLAWTTWVFGSPQQVEAMLTQWHHFLTTQGHQAQSAPPGAPVQ